MVCSIERLTRRPDLSCDEATTVQQAVECMARRGTGSAVVTRDGRVVGLFTERDLVNRVVGAGRDPGAVSLRDVCSRELVAIGHDSSCRQAVRKMQTHGCRRLLVYRGDAFLGVVRLTDVAHAIAAPPGRRDLVLNLVGGVTFVVAVGVIALLLYELPAMLQMAGQLGQ